MGAVAKGVSVEQYLKNPAYEHAEYVDGEIVERNVGGGRHSWLQGRFAQKFNNHFDSGVAGYAATEMHCRVAPNRYRIPDVAVVLEGAPPVGPLDRAPDLAVEVRSPEDSTAALLRKAQEYLAAGTKLVWVVLPEEKSILICTPEAPLRTVLAGETLDGGGVLPGLAIPVDELFQ